VYAVDSGVVRSVAMGAFRIHELDTVATMLEGGSAGDTVQIIGAGEREEVTLRERVAAGHKVALADIPAGAQVTKYGVPIGRATAYVARGAWVHLHNLASAFDTRSSTLDVHSGAPTDTVYR
jgi:hypothetical protein